MVPAQYLYLRMYVRTYINEVSTVAFAISVNFLSELSHAGRFEKRPVQDFILRTTSYIWH